LSDASHAAIVRVRPSPALGILFLALAGIDAAMYISAGGVKLLVLALLFVTGAITQLVFDLFVVGNGRVEIKNPLGMTTRTLAYSRLQIARRALLVTTGDATFKVNGMLASRRDWKKLAAAIDRGVV
jgi:hypothetical protein